MLGVVRRWLSSGAATERRLVQVSSYGVDGAEEDDGPIVLLELNAPKSLNALSDDMATAIEEQVALVQQRRPAARCVVVHGKGRAFSAGGSFDFIEQRIRSSPADNAAVLERFYAKFLSLRSSLDLPTIAAINGPAVGGGLGLALACDIRLAATDAYFSANFARLGLAAGAGIGHLLPLAVGDQFAKYMLLTGARVRADEAQQRGLVMETMSAAQLLPRAMEVAAEVAAASPVAVQLILKSMRAERLPTVQQALARDARYQAASFACPDILEGVAAAKNRRQPHFVLDDAIKPNIDF